MATLFSPYVQVETSAGVPASGAKLYFYAAGTTTPLTTYTDSGVGTPHADPVVADASGMFPQIWISASSYKFVLKTSADVTLLTVDNVAGNATFSDSLFTLQDGADTTKQVNFQLSSISTGTTRTKTLQDVSGTLYESGGTDVAVADGGTGASTALGALANLLPLGVVVPYAADSAPSGWLLCYGQAVSRTTYSALFAILSTTHGVGDGSTTFNLPDLRGRVIAGQDDMGGTSANRLTSPLNGDTFGAAGGAETYTILNANLPALISTTAGTILVAGGGGTALAPGAGAASITNTGGGTAMTLVQPTIILNYIIHAGV